MTRPNKTATSFCITILAVLCLSETNAFGIFVDGKGHYVLRGEARQNPSHNFTSAFQAIDQFFRLETEIRAGDHSSFFAEFQLFDDQKSAFLGDASNPEDCSVISEQGTGDDRTKYPSRDGQSNDCLGRPQNSTEPGYEPYVPRVRKAYARYNSDVCLLTVGRRGRSWGMGIYLDEGNNLFDSSASVYDGVTCDINIQKTQTMGFSFGYDKISETGSPLDLDNEDGESFGPQNQGDDLEQLFFSMVHDDTNTGLANFSKKIGIYFANIMGSGDLKTDIKIADLYVSFYTPDLVIEAETLFRLGKSADPNLSRLGGKANVIGDENPRNDVQSIAAAGRIDYFLSKSGALTGPKEFKRGNLTSHALFFEAAYAPGDKDGYISPVDQDGLPNRTDSSASAVAFHRNFKPALLLFNGRRGDDRFRVDGIYDPHRLMNTTMFSIGYEYKSMDSGRFNLKLIKASLNETIPEEVRQEYDANIASDDPELAAHYTPIGYKGTDLGWELDITWDTQYDTGFEFGGGVAMAIPGNAWEVNPLKKPKTQFLVQSYMAFTF